MKSIKIYFLSDDYVNYLRCFDKKIYYNKNSTRPYIGVVYQIDNHNYFAPLASPKPKHLIMNSKNIDIFKLDNGTLGIVNINNMIPVPIDCLTEALPIIKDKNYKNLIIKQLTFLNDNKQELLNKVHLFMLEYKKEHLPKNVKKRCCDFDLLEEKCKEYKIKYMEV